MITVTESAKAQINTHFAENEAAPLRIFIAYGCGGPKLGIGLDEKREGDAVMDLDGVTFVINEELMSAAENVTVDFTDQGFIVDSSLELELETEDVGECGPCGGCSGC